MLGQQNLKLDCGFSFTFYKDPSIVMGVAERLPKAALLIDSRIPFPQSILVCTSRLRQNKTIVTFDKPNFYWHCNTYREILNIK
jgi:hypothetical protein